MDNLLVLPAFTLKRVDKMIRLTAVIVGITALMGPMLADALYHHATLGAGCNIATPLNGSVDIICQHFNNIGKKSHCQFKALHWQRIDPLAGPQNISDSTKYGIWETIPGWGMEKGEYLSLLRVRNFVPEDIGQYRCEVLCSDSNGKDKHLTYKADACLDQPSSNYAVCSGNIFGDFCEDRFWNGVCDVECDNVHHFYDGYDCIKKTLSCDAIYDEYCAQHFANGFCDQGCDRAECSWDGGDCISSPIKFAEDTLVLVLSQHFKEKDIESLDLIRLGRSFSKLLRTIVRVFPDEWIGEHIQMKQTDTASHTKNKDKSLHRHKIYMKLDNTKCVERCFETAEQAAQYISLAVANGWDPGIPITLVGVLAKKAQICQLENNTLLHIDLSSVDRKGTSFGYHGDQSNRSSHFWVLIAAILGGVCSLCLLIAIIVIACRLKTTNREKQNCTLEEAERIRIDKESPTGTDV